MGLGPFQFSVLMTARCAGLPCRLAKHCGAGTPPPSWPYAFSAFNQLLNRPYTLDKQVTD